MWYRFFFLNIFFFFLKTDSTELFRAFELRASIRISQKKNPETIRLSNRVSPSFSSFNAPVNLKQWGGAKSRYRCLEELGYRSNLIRVFEIDAYPPWPQWRALLVRAFPSIPPSHNGCSIQAPRYSTAFVLEW